MSEDFNALLKEIRQTNLCTFYLLPLTGFTRFSFGEGIFINSYLERKRLWIIVQVADLHLVSERLRSHSVKQWSNDQGGFLAYELSSVWQDVIQLYIEGLYSRFPADVKSVIFERSGLPYKEQSTDERSTYTHILLLALDSKEIVRRYIEEELQVTLTDEQEVLGIPPPGSFMDVEEG